MGDVATGITGFDELIEGGFPRARSILVSGSPGTGKTIFALQYIYNGATTFSEKGLYVSFEEDAASLHKQAAQFSWNLKKAEQQGIVTLLCIAPHDITENTVEKIIGICQRNKISRIVIDSLSSLAINTPKNFNSVGLTEISIKRFLYRFITKLRDAKLSSLLIAHSSADSLSEDSVSEFICDGIVHIRYENYGGDYSRHLVIRKMREVKNDEDVHPLEISSKGIIVHNML